MHYVDIIEDIAIAMDINKLKPEWPRIWTVGNFAKETDETMSVAEIMVGLGFQEVLTYALTSPAVVSNNRALESKNDHSYRAEKLATAEPFGDSVS